MTPAASRAAKLEAFTAHMDWLRLLYQRGLLTGSEGRGEPFGEYGALFPEGVCRKPTHAMYPPHGARH